MNETSVTSIAYSRVAMQGVSCTQCDQNYSTSQPLERKTTTPADSQNSEFALFYWPRTFPLTCISRQIHTEYYSRIIAQECVSRAGSVTSVTEGEVVA